MKDDKDYADFLVQKILLIGYEVYVNSILSSIYKKFSTGNIPSYDEEAQKIIKLRSDLIEIIYVVSHIINGDPSVEKQWEELEVEDQSIYLDKLREEIIDEVNKIYYDNNENVDIIG